MQKQSTETRQLLLPYVAELELEVDRLRKHGQFIQHEIRELLKQILVVSASESHEGSTPPGLAQITKQAQMLATTLRDLRDTSGYHPSRDQVSSIALRPLVEQVFRWQQRLQDAPNTVLQLQLEMESLEWFPARLRHVLDNLLSNTLKYRDDNKQGVVLVELKALPKAYEVRVSNNGAGISSKDQAELFELFYRAVPARANGFSGGLAVVKFLVEQSGGSMTVDSGPEQGGAFVVVLPRYDVDDYLT